MNKIAYLLFPILTLLSSLQAVTNYPFPAHNTYYAGVIKPNNVTQNEMDEFIQTLYDEWKVEYLRTVPYASDQMYVFYNEDGESDPENAISVSEGQGYGMLLAVFMAGYDPDAQDIFDSLLRYADAFSSIITPTLMGWQQVEEDGIIDYGPEGGDHSATDGDLDIAFALLLADKQWGSGGSINYLARANEIIEDMMEADIDMEEFTLKLGDWVEDDDPEYGKATRPSDFAINHLKNFLVSTSEPKWDLVIAKTYAVINELFTNFSPTTGLLPDFSQFIDGHYVPADEEFLEREEDGYYSWNACRTPWRIATDYILTGDTRAYTQLTTLNNWIRNKTKQDPYKIKAGYKLDGVALETYDDLAFSAPFAVSAMISSNNQVWLNGLWTATSEEATSTNNYFGNTIRLLCYLVISGNWWTPLNLP